MNRMATPLSGIQDVTNHLVVPAPSLNTLPLASDTTPVTCASILAAANTSTPAAFLQLYSVPAITNSLQAFKTSLTSNVDQLQVITDTAGLAAIQTYLQSIDTVQLPILHLAQSCTGEANVDISMESANEAKEKLTTSMERLEFIQNPEEHVSYYEGWFPLFRPMVRTVLFILFGLSLLLLLLSIALFLRMNGIELQFILPSSSSFGSVGAMGTEGFSIPSSYTYAVGAGTVVGGILGYYGIKNGWF